MVTWQNLSSSLVGDILPITSFVNDFEGAGKTSFELHNNSYAFYGGAAAICTTFYLMLKKACTGKNAPLRTRLSIINSSIIFEIEGAGKTSSALHNKSYASYGGAAAIRMTFYLMLKKSCPRKNAPLRTRFPNNK